MNFIKNAITHWHTSLAGLAAALLVIANSYKQGMTWQQWGLASALALGGFAASDGAKAVTKTAIAVLLCLLFSGAAFAQDKQPVFTVGSQALAIHIGGQTVAGADEVAVFNVKGALSLQSDNVQFSSACSTCAAVSGQLYVAGPKYQLNALAKKLAGTNLAGIAPYVHGAIGVARNAPGVGPTTQHIAGMADLGFDYKVNGTFSFGPRAGLVIAPGVGPTCVVAPCLAQSPRGYFASVELLAVLGKK